MPEPGQDSGQDSKTTLKQSLYDTNSDLSLYSLVQDKYNLYNKKQEDGGIFYMGNNFLSHKLKELLFGLVESEKRARPWAMSSVCGSDKTPVEVTRSEAELVSHRVQGWVTGVWCSLFRFFFYPKCFVFCLLL